MSHLKRFLWDPTRTVTITHALLKAGRDSTPYEGLPVTGWPQVTLLRGKVIDPDATARP